MTDAFVSQECAEAIERSEGEGSLFGRKEMLRCAQHDSATALILRYCVVWYVGGAGVGDKLASTSWLRQVGFDKLSQRRVTLAELVEANHVIRLWELDGETLLALNRPALAALIGQTRLRDPKPALRQAVRQIVTGTRGELQELLLIELLTLCTDKELAAMAKQIVRYDRYGMVESPIIQEWKEEGRVEGRVEGQLKLLLRLLNRRYGALSAEMTAQVTALSATQMLDLADALLDFTSRAELERWLGEQRS